MTSHIEQAHNRHTTTETPSGIRSTPHSVSDYTCTNVSKLKYFEEQLMSSDLFSRVVYPPSVIVLKFTTTIIIITKTC